LRDLIQCEDGGTSNREGELPPAMTESM